jgi:serine/threonine-protein kinase
MPSAVGSLCLRCLAKDPADRPSASEVARSLAALVGLQPIIPPPTAREPSAVPARGAATPPSIPVRRGLGRAALAFLGLPGGTPGPRPPARTLRLRAGLRIGTALGMGGVRPLGGGVFARRSSLPTVSLRHRIQAVIGTVALLVIGGLAWTSSRGTPAVEQAQAAGAAPASVPQGTLCAVRYQLKRDSGSDYEALLTVAADDAVSGRLWRVQFAYPGSQKLKSPEKTVAQKGHKVVVKGRGKLRAFTLRGDYHGVNALPFSFSLNGHRCRAEVLGSMTGSAADDQQGVSEAAGNGSPSGRRVP